MGQRDARNPILNTLRKAPSAIFSECKDQQVPGYNCSFVSIIQSYNCKLFSLLDAEKVAEIGLLNVFRIGFPASLLTDQV